MNTEIKFNFLITLLLVCGTSAPLLSQVNDSFKIVIDSMDRVYPIDASLESREMTEIKYKMTILGEKRKESILVLERGNIINVDSFELNAKAGKYDHSTITIIRDVATIKKYTAKDQIKILIQIE